MQLFSYEYDQVISVQDALEIISRKLTVGVNFEVNSISLVYSPYKNKGVPTRPEEDRMETKAAWKVVLYNAQDKLNYNCYVDAKDGRYFRYSITLAPQKDDDEQEDKEK